MFVYSSKQKDVSFSYETTTENKSFCSLMDHFVSLSLLFFSSIPTTKGPALYGHISSSFCLWFMFHLYFFFLWSFVLLFVLVK